MNTEVGLGIKLHVLDTDVLLAGCAWADIWGFWGLRQGLDVPEKCPEAPEHTQTHTTENIISQQQGKQGPGLLESKSRLPAPPLSSSSDWRRQMVADLHFTRAKMLDADSPPAAESNSVTSLPRQLGTEIMTDAYEQG